MQEKLDGRRLLLKKDGDQITGINRLGFPASVPESIFHSAQRCKGSFLLDGEAVGDQFHAFDILSVDLEDMRPLRYAVRYFKMRDVFFRPTPMGTGISIEVEDIDIEWKPGVKTRSLEDVHKFRTPIPCIGRDADARRHNQTAHGL